jgi:hypothetical protein
MVFARIRAHVVLPTPRGPQNRKAWANWLLRIAFFRVPVIEICPTTVSNVTGRYLRADTIKLSIMVSKLVYYITVMFANRYFF